MIVTFRHVRMTKQPPKPQVALVSTAGMNSILASAPTLEYQQRAMYVSQTLLANRFSALAAGEITSEDFENSVRLQDLLKAVDETELKGVLDPNQPEVEEKGDGKNKKVRKHG
jgi:hypothetical protein